MEECRTDYVVISHRNGGGGKQGFFASRPKATQAHLATTTGNHRDPSILTKFKNLDAFYGGTTVFDVDANQTHSGDYGVCKHLMMLLEMFIRGLLDLLRKSTFDRPAELNPGVNGISRNACPLGPFAQQERFSVVGNLPIGSPVSALLRWCRPDAIVFAVIAVVILPLDTVGFAGARSHVSVERFKGFTPARANLNPATAVPVIAFVGLVFAPCNDVLPSIPFGSVPHSVGYAAGIVVTQAAATPGHMVPQSGRSDDHYVPAFAGTFPSSVPAFGSTGETNNLQSPKGLPNKIDGVRMQAESGVAKIGVSHVTSYEGCDWLEPVKRSSASSARFIVSPNGRGGYRC